MTMSSRMVRKVRSMMNEFASYVCTNMVSKSKNMAIMRMMAMMRRKVGTKERQKRT